MFGVARTLRRTASQRLPKRVRRHRSDVSSTNRAPIWKNEANAPAFGPGEAGAARDRLAPAAVLTGTASRPHPDGIAEETRQAGRRLTERDRSRQEPSTALPDGRFGHLRAESPDNAPVDPKAIKALPILPKTPSGAAASGPLARCSPCCAAKSACARTTCCS